MGDVMKIVAHKSNEYSYDAFLNEIVNNPRIIGISFDVLMTNDKKIVIYTPTTNYLSSIDTVQNYPQKELEKNNTPLLEATLKKIKNSNKKIIINLLPIVSIPTDENSLINVNIINTEYVAIINQILDQFPMLEFYLCSAYDNLVFQLKRLKKNYKVGFIITNLSSNYIDVDFYAFTTNMINKEIITQQLSINKEIMLYVLNCDDMNQTMRKIYQASPYFKTTQNIINEIYFINNYPNLFLKLFS